MFNKSSLIELPGAVRHQIWVENRIISKGAVPSGTELFQAQIKKKHDLQIIFRFDG
jgi:hypothetical protein